MRTLIIPFLSLGLTILAPGCGKDDDTASRKDKPIPAEEPARPARDYETIVKNGLETLEEMAHIMSKLKTAEDVKMFAGRLKRLRQTAEKLEKERDALGEQPIELKDKMRKKYEERLQELEKKAAAARAAMTREAREEIKRLKLRI